MEALAKIDLHQFSESITGAYANIPLSLVNDHVNLSFEREAMQTMQKT
ncbi:hypothetical protein [Pedobacter heparinus]|nr:hypothetical protein [Pedobacter heparinus]